MRGRPGCLFSDGDLFAALEGHFAKIDDKVNAIPERQFLKTDDDAVVEHVASELEVQPIELHEDAKTMEHRETTVDVTGRFEYFARPGEGPVLVPGLEVTVSVPFTGDPGLWKLRPSQWRTTFPCGQVRRPGNDGVGYLDITLKQPSKTEPDAFKHGLEATLGDVRFYLASQRKQVEQNNQQLRDRVRQAVVTRRERLASHASVVDALNIPLKERPGAPDMSLISVKRRVVKPLPPAPNEPPEPGISHEDYERILSIIRHEGRSFEATPKTFAKHDEEELRDIILAHLNGHFQGGATGETFRRTGKTDIRIEDKDRAAFVGECKVWRGQAELSRAIDQLLSYLTWRDCKAALVVFNKDVAGFSGIQDKLPQTIEAHGNFVKALPCDQTGEWRYHLRSMADDQRLVTLHVFLFDLFVRTPENGDREAEH